MQTTNKKSHSCKIIFKVNVLRAPKITLRFHRPRKKEHDKEKEGGVEQMNGLPPSERYSTKSLDNFTNISGYGTLREGIDSSYGTLKGFSSVCRVTGLPKFSITSMHMVQLCSQKSVKYIGTFRSEHHNN